MSRAVLWGGLGAALSWVATAGDARACGGCFHERGPTQSGTVITDHRMIFAVSPTQTTLYDEIEYQGSAASFAWVLPIHGPVAVGLSSDALFAALDQVTQTTIVAPTLPPCPSPPSCDCGDDGNGSFDLASDAATLPNGSAVTVIDQAVVGPYDTVQLQSTDPMALENWLTANGYAIPTAVQPVIAAYVQEGFDFLALRLAPGQGVQAMRPVSVTAPGAGLSLPLRMVAAGTGATVGITLWVVSTGSYEPQNFSTFTIDPADLVWDWSKNLSNYSTLVSQKEASLGNAAWQIESALDLSPTRIEAIVLARSAASEYLSIPGADAGEGGASVPDAATGETADQVRKRDLATCFAGGTAYPARITRMRADLAQAALANDLVLQASADQRAHSNVYSVSKSIHAPTCPTYSPVTCPPCPDPNVDASGDDGGMPSFDTPGALSGGRRSSGCALAAHAPGAGLGIVAAGLGLAALSWRRNRRRR
ncbi:MAG TPA: DUF2330 domain-containing protein [Polyangiaceae bacterium]|nr:DUF2330 domain-containing protein [Polyangiaceae bacterium]